MSSARIGYARVSTSDQSLDAQVDALKKAGCSVIRCETKSGSRLKDRDELRSILDFIRAGDTLIVTRIDRLARSVSDVQTIVNTLREKEAFLLALHQPVDTSDAGGKAFFDMLAVFAEFENNLRRERQAEGIHLARQKGLYRGRVAKLDQEEILVRLLRGEGPIHIARTLNISRSSVYKVKVRAEEQASKGEQGNGFQEQNPSKKLH